MNGRVFREPSDEISNYAKKDSSLDSQMHGTAPEINQEKGKYIRSQDDCIQDKRKQFHLFEVPEKQPEEVHRVRKGGSHYRCLITAVNHAVLASYVSA